MKPRVEIFPASTADLCDLVPMVEQYWRFESIEAFDAARVAGLLEKVIAQPALGRVWLARVDDSAAAYLLAVYVFSLEHQGMTAEIDEFFVMPGYRRLGLGGQLLKTAERAFRADGCTKVALQIGRDNTAARAFYRRHGYGDRAGFELVDKTL